MKKTSAKFLRTFMLQSSQNSIAVFVFSKYEASKNVYIIIQQIKLAEDKHQLAVNGDRTQTNKQISDCC